MQNHTVHDFTCFQNGNPKYNVSILNHKAIIKRSEKIFKALKISILISENKVKPSEGDSD